MSGMAGLKNTIGGPFNANKKLKRVLLVLDL